MKINIKLFFINMIATFFYSGYSKKAPGTMGSLFAVIAYLLLMNIFNRQELIFITVGIFFIGWYCCSYLVKNLNNTDPQIIVIDEVIGIFITMTMVPIIYTSYPYDLIFAGLSFVLFRFFDIAKPFPVSWADTKVKGGLGVMLDDVFAGFLAGFTIWIGVGIHRILINYNLF